ncbi:MAG: hypothetical protein K0Q59_2756 [Paenibacillus sp.]|nr:hypothetical protein [Paenibacillus sp.]
MQAHPLHAIVYGLGPIGAAIMQNALKSTHIRLLGAVDIDPHKIGTDLGVLVQENPAGIRVVGSIGEVDSIEANGRKFAFHATGSNLQQVWPQIKLLLDEGYSVVSTCEELSFPWHRYPELSRQIDQYARDRQQLVIGAGVNPGYVMDALALFATTVTQTITGVYISRKVDVAKRRVPLQKKVGIGMEPQLFRQLAQENRIGHVGLEESLRMIAYGLNLTLTEVQNSIEPTIAEEDRQLAIGPLHKEEVSGLHQQCRGATAEGIAIELDLVMSIGIVQEDRIVIETKEMGNIELVIPGGIFGDSATSNIIVNTAKVLHAYGGCGLLTMADIKLGRNIIG